jgi:hypothetical protein
MKSPVDPRARRTSASEDQDAPFPGLAALRDVEPPPSLVPAVMRRVAEPAPPSFWRWLMRPRRFELRFSAAGLGALAAVGVIVVLALRLGPEQQRGSAMATAPEPAASAASTPAQAQQAPEVVQVRFVFFAPGAKKVSLVGDFNEWNAQGTVLEPVDAQGTFTATLPLRRGTHEYMFNVDGRWVTDPAAAERRPDGFGRENGVLRL